MLFDFEEEQYAFRDVVRSALGRHMPASAVRAEWNEPVEGRGGAWSQLVHLGVLAMTVPEKHGGLGGTFVDLVLPLEEIGYHAVTGPVLATAAVAAPVLANFAADDIAAKWLPRIATGETAFALALDGSELVSHFNAADAVIVRSGQQLHLVQASAVRAEPVESMDPTLRLSRCSFDLDRSTLLTEDPDAADLAMQLGTIATSSVLVGLSQRMSDMTRAYLLERHQFGQVIGSFQALKHRMADVAVATEAARGLAWYAAYAAATMLVERAEAAHLAKASANHAAHLAGSAALQLHGGIGFTWEHDLHLWLQRAKALETLFGSIHEHRQEIAEHVFAH